MLGASLWVMGISWWCALNSDTINDDTAKENNTQSVHGLTTAASIWICGLLGTCFGAGAILLGAISLGFIIFILTIGGSLEKILSSLLGIKHISELPKNKKSKKSK